MKKALLVFLVLALVLVVGVAIAAADSDNAALVISLDEGCEWWTDTMEAAGSVHYAEAMNGKWKLTCIGEIVDGPLPEQTFIRRSTAENPLDEICYTPFGETYDWREVYTPSGESSLVCHGDLSP
jgi:hypothetical protein